MLSIRKRERNAGRQHAKCVGQGNSPPQGATARFGQPRQHGSTFSIDHVLRKDTVSPIPSSGTPSALRTPDDGHQLGDLLALICLVAASDCGIDTMSHVIPQNFFLQAAQCGTNGRDLRYHVNAVAVLIHHFQETPDLPLDSLQPLLTRCLDIIPHGALYTPAG